MRSPGDAVPPISGRYSTTPFSCLRTTRRIPFDGRLVRMDDRAFGAWGKLFRLAVGALSGCFNRTRSLRMLNLPVPGLIPTRTSYRIASNFPRPGRWRNAFGMIASTANSKRPAWTSPHEVLEVCRSLMDRRLGAVGYQPPKERHHVQKRRLAAGVGADQDVERPQRLAYVSQAAEVKCLYQVEHSRPSVRGSPAASKHPLPMGLSQAGKALRVVRGRLPGAQRLRTEAFVRDPGVLDASGVVNPARRCAVEEAGS